MYCKTWIVAEIELLQFLSFLNGEIERCAVYLLCHGKSLHRIDIQATGFNRPIVNRANILEAIAYGVLTFLPQLQGQRCTFQYLRKSVYINVLVSQKLFIFTKNHYPEAFNGEIERRLCETLEVLKSHERFALNILAHLTRVGGVLNSRGGKVLIVKLKECSSG